MAAGDWELLGQDDFELGEVFGFSFPVVGNQVGESQKDEEYTFLDRHGEEDLPPRPCSALDAKDLFPFSVKIFPPPPSVLSREYFTLIFLPGIRTALRGDRRSRLAPDRGWRSEKEFEIEFSAALRNRNCFLEGIVIARRQLEDEARLLAESVSELQVCEVAGLRFSDPCDRSALAL
jgi:hypothetical protein